MTSPMTENPADFYPIELKTYELDHRSEMPLWVIYRFLQEAAEYNAVDLGFDTESMLKRSLTWLLVRLQLRVGSVPTQRTTVRAESWPSGVQSRFALRDFRLWWDGATEPFAVASPQLHSKASQFARSPLQVEKEASTLTCRELPTVRL